MDWEFSNVKKIFWRFFQLIGPRIAKQNIRKAVPVEKKIACILYYLLDKGRMRKIADAFGLRKSSVSKVIRQVCKYISINLKCLIKLPNNIDKVNKMVWKFYIAHWFPQCLDAVDGSHVSIKKPKTNTNDYTNRKSHCTLFCKNNFTRTKALILAKKVKNKLRTKPGLLAHRT